MFVEPFLRGVGSMGRTQSRRRSGRVSLFPRELRSLLFPFLPKVLQPCVVLVDFGVVSFGGAERHTGLVLVHGGQPLGRHFIHGGLLLGGKQASEGNQGVVVVVHFVGQDFVVGGSG